MGNVGKAQQATPDGLQMKESSIELCGRGLLMEVLWGTLCLLLLMGTMRSALFSGTTTLAHDQVYWVYPWYQFTTESLLQGRLPLWNPFTHGGEPFYPLLSQLRILDPVSPFVVWIGSLFTQDLLILFAWDRLARGVTFAFGSYLLLRGYAQHAVTRYSLFPLLLWSSFQIGPLRQDAIMGHFLWAPWAILALLRLVCERDYRWRNWLLAAWAIGMQWQSYLFAGTWIWIFLFLAGVLWFHREWFVEIVKTRGTIGKCAVALLVITSMCLPNMVLFLEQGRYVFPARMVDPSMEEGGPIGGPQQWEPGPTARSDQAVVMSYEGVARTGTPSRTLDFIQLITPWGNTAVTSKGWGSTSEAFMYFGILPWFIALWGLLAGAHPLKHVWGVIGIGFGLLMLGPIGGLHPLIFYLCPPLWFARHTHALVLFFSLAILYFYVIGCNSLLKEPRNFAIQWDAAWGNLLKRVNVWSMRWGGGAEVITSATESNIAGGDCPTRDHTARVRRVLLAIGICIAAGVLSPRNVGTYSNRLLGWSLLLHIDASVIRGLQGIGFALAVFMVFRAVKGLPLNSSLVWGVVMPAGLIGVAFAVRNYRVELPYLPLIPFLLLIVVVGTWQMRLRLGAARVFWVIASAHVLTVLFMERNQWLYLGLFLAVGGLPVAGFVLGRRIVSERWGVLLPFLVLFVVMCDLSHYLTQAKGLWDWSRPDRTMGIHVEPVVPSFPGRRLLVVDSSREGEPYDQAVRYQEALFRTPTVLPRFFGSSGASIRGSHSSDSEGLGWEERRRWSTYLMLKPYYRLIHAEIPAQVKEDMFAINSPLLQFKAGAKQVADEEPLAFLKPLGTAGAREWLRNSLVLPQGTDLAHCPSLEAAVRHNEVIDDGDVVAANLAGFRWRVLDYDYNSLSASVDSGEQGFLYWADGFDSSWKAYVDGREVPVLRANVNFKAICIAVGKHHVRFLYAPTWYMNGAMIFLVMGYGLMLSLLGDWIFSVIRRGLFKAVA